MKKIILLTLIITLSFYPKCQSQEKATFSKERRFKEIEDTGARLQVIMTVPDYLRRVPVDKVYNNYWRLTVHCYDLIDNTWYPYLHCTRYYRGGKLVQINKKKL